MLWFLIIQLTGGNTTGPLAPSQLGPFKSQAACEAAGKQVQKTFAVRFVCVADGA